jgi:hypothetical protein
MAHTPGPWRFAQDGREPYWNVDMPMQDGSPGYGFANAMVYTTEEDARLIAAAPDLLDALKRCVQWLSDLDNDICEKAELLNAMDAIAKAEGVTMEGTNGKERSLD